MNKQWVPILMLSAVLLSTPAYALSTKKTMDPFNDLFTRWTEAFNHRNLTGSCELFSQSVVADYQGVPQKHYADICNGFKKIFLQKDYQYTYNFKLHDIYLSGNLAAARITWYLAVYKNGKKISATQDEGIDVLKKNNTGNWQIVNYLAYGKEIAV